MKTDKSTKLASDSPKCKTLSIKEKVEAANYAMKVSGCTPEDEDISDVIGEVYGG